MDAWRAGTKPEPIKPESLPWLIRLYEAERGLRGAGGEYQAVYRESFKVLEAWSARAEPPHPRIQRLERKAIMAFKRALAKQSKRKAYKALGTLRVLLGFAVNEGFLDENPARRLNLKAPPARQAVWSGDDLRAFYEAAEQAGQPSVGLAALLVNLGQRQGDLLRLSWSQYQGGAFRIRQGKTGTLIEVPVTDELRAALDAVPRRPSQIVLSEETGRAYRADNFRALFSRVRDAAGLEGLQFLDLRRTAVVRLAEAGCTNAEIAAITGHSIDRTETILEVYLPRNTQMARNAIAKLEAYRKEEVGSSDREAGGGVGRWCPGADLNHRHADFQSAFRSCYLSTTGYALPL